MTVAGIKVNSIGNALVTIIEGIFAYSKSILCFDYINRKHFFVIEKRNYKKLY